MTKIYGGLFLENLVKSDMHYDLQMDLLNKGLIQGIQLRVAHPSFTPGLTSENLPGVLSMLPQNCGLFVHCGAENTGVDFGENLDECGVFAEKHKETGVSWYDYNIETLEWALEVAELCGCQTVVHPGYGESENDIYSYKKMIGSLKKFSHKDIVIEILPAITYKHLWEKVVGKKLNWSRNSYWGFGGTPRDMGHTLSDLGSGWKCLVDFTHLFVTVINQANKYGNLKKTIKDYLELPHSRICHFSGAPETLIDNHGFIDIVSRPIRNALQKFEAVCLEIKFNSESENVIKRFRKNYL